MSFKIGRFFYLTFSFVLGTFFFIVGLFGILLPWSPFLKGELIRLIEQETLLLSLFGLGLLLVGLSILIYMLVGTRRHYSFIQTGRKGVFVDEALVRHYIDSYWQEHFPRHHVPSYLTIKRQSIHIVADLPFLPLEEQKSFLEKVKNDFADIFGRLLGYPHEVYLVASFGSP